MTTTHAETTIPEINGAEIDVDVLDTPSYHDQEIPLFAEFAMTKGSSAIRDSLCSFCWRIIEKTAPTVTHLGTCSNAWCLGCFLQWTQTRQKHGVRCPVCRENARKLSQPGMYDEETDAVRLQIHTTATNSVVSSSSEAHSLIRGLAGMVKLEHLFRDVEQRNAQLSAYPKINVDPRITTKDLVQQRDKLGFGRDDDLELWRYSRLLGVAYWTRHNFPVKATHSFFLPSVGIPGIVIPGTDNLDQSAPAIGGAADTTDVLQVPLLTRIVRQVFRAASVAASVAAWKGQPLSDFCTTVEKEIDKLNDIATRHNIKYWCILTLGDGNEIVTFPTEDDTNSITRPVVVPCTNQQQIADRHNYQKLRSALCSGRLSQVGTQLGWTTWDDAEMLEALLEEFALDDKMDEDLEAEVVKWWGAVKA